MLFLEYRSNVRVEMLRDDGAATFSKIRSEVLNQVVET